MPLIPDEPAPPSARAAFTPSSARSDPKLGGDRDRPLNAALAKSLDALENLESSYRPASPKAPIPIYIGIDPGVHGGLAAISGASGAVIAAAMSDSKGQRLPDAEILGWLKRLVAPGESAPYAVLELVGGYAATEEGREGLPGARMFEFGDSYGMLRGFMLALGIPFDLVRPQEWQKVYCTRKRRRARKGVPGEKRGEWKNYLKGLAQNLFPKEKVTLSICDALLLADLCRRRHTT